MNVIRYECPRCRRGVDLAFKPTAPPACPCRKGKAVTAMVVVQKVGA
jgi:hypothetical protein